MTQDELLPQIYKKDDKAFTLLYDMYAKCLFGVIFNIIKDKEEAEAILQETFVKIWKNIEMYDQSKGRFFTWMLNMARNMAIDKLQSKNVTIYQKNTSADNFVRILDDNSQINTKIDTIGIHEFVKKLKPKCVQLIDLLFFKGYTQQEAADALEIPLGTVKTQNRSCISELRNLLKV